MASPVYSCAEQAVTSDAFQWCIRNHTDTLESCIHKALKSDEFARCNATQESAAWDSYALIGNLKYCMVPYSLSRAFQSCISKINPYSIPARCELPDADELKDHYQQVKACGEGAGVAQSSCELAIAYALQESQWTNLMPDPFSRAECAQTRTEKVVDGLVGLWNGIRNYVSPPEPVNSLPATPAPVATSTQAAPRGREPVPCERVPGSPGLFQCGGRYIEVAY